MRRPSVFTLTAPPPPELTEAEVSEQIRMSLQYCGWLVIRNHVGKFVPSRIAREALSLPDDQALTHINRNTITINDPGTPDLLAVHPVYPALWIEVKRRGGKVRGEQIERLWYLREKLGYHADVCESLDAFRAFYQRAIEKAAA